METTLYKHRENIPAVPYMTPPKHIHQIQPLNNFGYINTLLARAMSREPLKVKRVNENGSRKSGKTESWLWASNVLLFQNKIEVDVFWVRKQMKDANELYSKIENLMEGYNINLRTHSNRTKRRAKYNKNQLRVLGLDDGRVREGKSTANLGLERAINKDLVVVVFEERNQISNDEVQAVMEAIGGYRQILEVHISNPWLIHNEFISYNNLNFPYREETMKTKYDQYKYNEAQQEIWHYSTHWLNPFLSRDERIRLWDLEHIDPRRSRVSNWGLPGSAEGTIYGGYIERVKEPMNHQPDYFVAGIDWGKTKDDTVCIFGGIGHNSSWVAAYDMYRHNNKESAKFKSSNEMVKDIIDFLERMGKKYPRVKGQGLNIYVEYMVPGIIAMLNNQSRERGLTWLSFSDCLKHSINRRVDEITLAMGLGRVFISREKCSMLIQEFEASVWDERKTGTDQPKRLDKNDHSINAFEYMVAYVSNDLIEGYESVIK